MFRDRRSPYIRSVAFALAFLFWAMDASFAFQVDSRLTAAIHKRYKTDKLRILIMDFTSAVDPRTAVAVSDSMRETFIKNKNFVTLKIPEVNKIIASRRFSSDPEKIAYASFIGKKLNAHKIIIADVTTASGTILTDIRVIDVVSGKVDLLKKAQQQITDIDNGMPGLVRDIAFDIFGIEEKKLTGTVRQFVRSETSGGGKAREREQKSIPVEKQLDTGLEFFTTDKNISVSTGMLAPQGALKNKINNGLLTSLHYTMTAPRISWISADFAAGYSALNGTIEEGKADMVYVPLLATAAISVPHSGKSLLGLSSLIIGGGATYLSLSTTQDDVNKKKSGFEATGVIGLSTTIIPFDRYFCKLEAMYIYLYDKAYVAYIYTGIRMGFYF